MSKTNSSTDRQLGDLQKAVALQAPTTSGVSRDAVAAIVDGVISEAAKSMAALRKSLDLVEGLLLENAAHIKGELQEHVDLGTLVLEESERVTELVDRLQRQQERRLRRSAE